jgi:glycerol-3-phosphate acyltransferase PlsY
VDPRRIVPAAAHSGAAPAHIHSPYLLHSLVVFLPFVIVAAVAYLLGSIPFAYILMRVFRKQDIRTVGSGNVGATNVVRTGAYGLGAATFVCDVLKGCCAVWLGVFIASALAPGVDPMNAKALAAFFAVFGHIFTFWLRFHGGKGVATGFGVFLVIAPWAALAALGTFALAIAISRYVAVGSIVGAASFAVYVWFLVPGSHTRFIFSAVVLVVGLIIAKHHSNISRLIHGTEFKIGAKNQE